MLRRFPLFARSRSQSNSFLASLFARLPRGFEQFGPSKNHSPNLPDPSEEGEGSSKSDHQKSSHSGGNSNSNNNSNNNSNKSGPPFKWTQVALPGAVALAALYSASRQQAQQHEVAWQDLVPLLNANRITRIEIVSPQHAKVYIAQPPLLHPSSSSHPNHTTTTGGRMTSSDHHPSSSPSSLPNHQPPSAAVVELLAILRFGSLPLIEKRLMDYDDVNVVYQAEFPILSELSKMIPTLLLLGFFAWSMRAARSGPASPFAAKTIGRTDKSTIAKVTFADVAGMKEAKQELEEFVSYLRDTTKFTKIGAKVPKGALLMGPPGTGKTLLAKAIAGESDCAFYNIAASEFMEMFVGVGPQRVRDLFKQARENKPSIIYIDEIDAIGKPRGSGRSPMGGNDERENTLNQLLVEMDGFASNDGVIVLASTNVGQEGLDKALLRPGRFDRIINVDLPEREERMEILGVHMKKIKLSPSETPDAVIARLAELTPGFAGADLANVVNEGALVAAREITKKEVEAQKKEQAEPAAAATATATATAAAATEEPKITVPEPEVVGVKLRHFEAAIDRVVAGLERKSRVLSAEERRIVAYHESGHALVSWLLPLCEPLLKVSIVPRGSAALGYAQYVPRDQEYIKTQEQLLQGMCMALGGRAAEKVVFGHLSTGAQDDLRRVTEMAYSMVTRYGMGANEQVNLTFRREMYSQMTATAIDVEVRRVIAECVQRAEMIIRDHRDMLESLAQRLLEREVLNTDDVKSLLGDRPEGQKIKPNELI